MKTSELTGAALDWAVAKCEHDIRRHNYGEPCFNSKTKRVYETAGLQQIGVNFAPSTDWAQGGPIIEREGIVVHLTKEHGWISAREFWFLQDEKDHDLCSTGQTYLVAAMRCYVASKLGDEVDIPKELA